MSRLKYDDNFESVNTFRYTDRPPGDAVNRRSQPQGLSAGPRHETLPQVAGLYLTISRGRRKEGGGAMRTPKRGGEARRPDAGRHKGAPRAHTSATQLSNSSAAKPNLTSKSDTLLRDCFVLEGLSFHQLTLSDKLTPEMLGLNGLIDALYVKLSGTNTYFSKHVAKSVFSYYCCVISYARLLHLARGVGNPLTTDEVAFVDFINGSSFLVPEPLKLYLAAFGNTFLSSGTKIKFRLAARQYVKAEGISRFFGPVNENAHYLYGAYRCLGVSVSRIIADAK